MVQLVAMMQFAVAKESAQQLGGGIIGERCAEVFRATAFLCHGNRVWPERRSFPGYLCIYIHTSTSFDM